MIVTFNDVDGQSVAGRTARAVNRATGEVHTVTIAGGEADFGQLTYQQAYEVYGVTASGARVTSVLVKTETSQPSEPPQSAPSLSATAVSGTRINLTIGSVSGATGYEYRVDGGTPVDVGTNRTPQVTGLAAETQYSFEARAYNEEGAGPWSSVVQATTQAAGAGVVLTESFNKPDGPGLGPDLTWSTLRGDFRTEGGYARSVAAGDPAYGRADHDLDTDQHYAEIVVTSIDADRQAGLLLRVDSASSNNYLRFIVARFPQVWRLSQIVDGQLTDLQETPFSEVPEPSAPYTLRAEIGADGIFRGFINGVECVSATPAQPHAGKRRTGLVIAETSELDVLIESFTAGDL